MLEIHIPTIVFEIINFIALAALLYFFLLKPGMKRVDARNREKKRIEKEIQENLAISEKTRFEWESRLENIQEEILEIVEKNRRQMELEREEILAGIKEEARTILEASQLEAIQRREQAMVEFQDDILDAIVEISAQVIRELAPAEIHETLIKQMHERIWRLGKEEMERVEIIRRSIDQRKPTAYVKSAKPLTREQEISLARTLSALADSEIDLELSIIPKMASGLYVRIGDIVLDNTVYAQLEEYRKEISLLVNEKVVNE